MGIIKTQTSTSATPSLPLVGLLPVHRLYSTFHLALSPVRHPQVSVEHWRRPATESAEVRAVLGLWPRDSSPK